MRLGALEAGGTKMVCAIGNEQGEIFEQVSIPTQTPEITGSSTLAQPQNPYKPQKCGIFLSNFLRLYVVWRCVLCYNKV